MEQTYLNAIASIYGNTHLTIITVEKTEANHDIPRVGGGSSPRKQPLSVAILDRYQFLARQYWEQLQFPRKSKWASRGWALQEAVFSRRILIFNGLVSWVC